MNDLMQFLQQRNSSPRLVDPAPTAAELEEIFRAALRAPDHAWLRPWRFITIAGDRRRDFGLVLERGLCQRNPQANEAALQKARNSPLRAPLLVVVVARLSDHPKVPAIEQRLSEHHKVEHLVNADLLKNGEHLHIPSFRTFSLYRKFTATGSTAAMSEANTASCKSSMWMLPNTWNEEQA